MSDPLVSHGRGGAANIGKDSTPYTDGEIVREGPVGDQGDGPYSSGRGGQGNIGSPHVKATNATTGDGDVIPETALRSDNHENYHVGRGGEGNEVKTHNGEKKQMGLADKLKSKFFGKKEGK